MGAPVLTARQRILVTMHTLAGKGIKEVPTPDLVYYAWADHPGVFGLKTSLVACPDSNKVICDLSGKKGLVLTGYLVRPRAGMYALTRQGAKAAAELAGGEVKTHKLAPLKLPEWVGERLAVALGSRAFFKFRSGLSRDVNWPEAQGFWGGADEQAGFQAFLDHLTEYQNDDGEIVMADGRTEPQDTITMLRKCDMWLSATFARRLEQAHASGR